MATAREIGVATVVPITAGLRSWTLPPSDFAFLWEECRRCFYLKVVHGIRRPSGPMPKIFTTIDLAMKHCFADKRTEEILPELPPGRIVMSDRMVESAPIRVVVSRFHCAANSTPSFASMMVRLL